LAFPGYCTSKNDQKSCMFYRSFFHIFFQKWSKKGHILRL
jgi:hypothetical protein